MGIHFVGTRGLYAILMKMPCIEKSSYYREDVNAKNPERWSQNNRPGS